MLFSSLEFLFYFLPGALGLYFVTPPRWRNAVLLGLSLVFYTWGAGAYLGLLLLSAASAYLTGRWAESLRARSPEVPRAPIVAVVAVNLGVLGYFKYADWAVHEVDRIAGWLWGGELDWTAVALPLGISFFSYQAMSYTIDVARGRVAASRNPVDFGLYLALFPQLIAGPIVRYRTVARQLASRTTTVEGFAEGAIRFVHGLAKKVIVGDTIGRIVDAVYALPPGEETFVAAWIGTIGFALQLYFDFSGYTDMAIGLGRMFGFRLPENFLRPHSAVSVTDFWLRWHITLSTWFRDYLYTPIRGRSANPLRVYGGLLLTFVLIGIWHGASLTFVVFGAIHGTALVVERLTGNDVTATDVHHQVPRRVVTMLVLLVSLPFFRAGSMSQAGRQLTAMVNPGGLELPEAVSLLLGNRPLLVLVAAASVFVLPRTLVIGRRIAEGSGPLLSAARAALLVVALPYATALVAVPGDAPFIYFQF